MVSKICIFVDSCVEEIAKEFHKYNAEKELSILIQHDNKNLQKQASNLIQIIAQTGEGHYL